jgi:hypothetical protein
VTQAAASHTLASPKCLPGQTLQRQEVDHDAYAVAEFLTDDRNRTQLLADLYIRYRGNARDGIYGVRGKYLGPVSLP